MARTIRGYLTPAYGNLRFPSSILVEFLVLAKFAGIVTSPFRCIVPEESLFP